MRTLVLVARRSAHRHASLVSTCGSSGAIVGYDVGLVTANRGQLNGPRLTSLASPLVGVMYLRQNPKFSLRNRTIVIWASKSEGFCENRGQPCVYQILCKYYMYTGRGVDVAPKNVTLCHVTMKTQRALKNCRFSNLVCTSRDALPRILKPTDMTTDRKLLANILTC